MDKIPEDIIREICKYLYVKECITIEQLIFKSIPKYYQLWDLVDYVERKKYEPYVVKIDAVSFHLKYNKGIFDVIVLSKDNYTLEKYYIRNVPDAAAACSKSIQMFLRGPGYWYGNFYYPVMQYI